MADVVLPVEFAPLFQPPPICAVTGRPTTKRMSLEIVRVPKWAYLGLLVGFLPFIVIYLVASKRVRTTVSIRGATRVQHALVKAAALIGTLLSVIAAIVLMVEPGVAALVFAAVVGVPTALAMRHHLARHLRGKWLDSTTVVVKNLHPSFADALQTALQRATQERMQFLPGTSTSTGVPAGWYGDPSGRFHYRYWDGAAWTEHTSGERTS